MAAGERNMKITAAIALLLATATPATAQDITLYRGGPIVTMDGDTPKTVEAVVTRGDRITFAGNEAGARATAGKDAAIHDLRGATMLRSEEHTSELQSLMRTSYAVFCL